MSDVAPPEGESTPTSPILNGADAEAHVAESGEHWGGEYRVLTPFMKEQGGSLGVCINRMPPGRAGSPFHYHMREDEAFYIISGTGTLRYGDEVFPLRAGDCVSCPAGTKVAHQLANTGDEDLVYLGIGPNDPDEVCVYPDSGKVMVRHLRTVGVLKKTDYMHGEAERPAIFDMSSGEKHESDQD